MFLSSMWAFCLTVCMYTMSGALVGHKLSYPGTGVRDGSGLSMGAGN